MKHTLKTDPAAFQAVADGAKTYEIRFNDRGFAVGDELLLRETTATGADIAAGAELAYTGREITKHVSHVLTGYGLADGWAILSFGPTARDAGTIDTPELEKLMEEYRTAAFFGGKQRQALVAHIDKHVAAAVADIDEDRQRAMGVIARLEADLAKLRSTAGVGEAVWDALRKAKVALNHSSPHMSHYHEPVKRHDEALAAVVAALVKRPPADSAATAPVSAVPAAEAAQRERMRQRFADRPRTPATADFDLPAPNDTQTEPGAHHLTPENIEAMAADLEALALGESPIGIDSRDWITLSWIIAKVIRHLSARAALPPSAGAPVSAAEPAKDVCAEMRALCSACGGTGDVTSIDGEWRGTCDCEASKPPADGQELPALPKHNGEFRGERMFDLYTLRQYARDALAMRQPQGEAIQQKINELGATSVHGDHIHPSPLGRARAAEAFAAAKQAGKEAS